MISLCWIALLITTGGLRVIESVSDVALASRPKYFRRASLDGRRPGAHRYAEFLTTQPIAYALVLAVLLLILCTYYAHRVNLYRQRGCR